MKYFVDLYGDNFDVNEIESRDTIYSGSLSEIGIEENDTDYTNKLDEFLETELGIAPNEWEIG